MDFDKIAREICEKGTPCLKELTEHFGDDIIDCAGNLKRKELGDIVFKNPQKLDALNSITRKYILEKAELIKKVIYLIGENDLDYDLSNIYEKIQ